MTTFILSETPPQQLNGKTYKGRLILDESSHGEQIESFNADSWLEAREKINESKYEHIQNHGWFVPDERMVA